MPECQFPRFSKIPLKGGREKRRNGAQPQNEILRKGVWGTAPTSRNCGFRQRREPQFRAFVGTKTLLATMVTPPKTGEMAALCSGPHLSYNGREPD